MTIDSNTGLETANYSTPNWVHIHNKNVELLNDLLLRVSGLVDVDLTGLEDGQILMWDGSEFVPRTWDGLPN